MWSKFTISNYNKFSKKNLIKAKCAYLNKLYKTKEIIMNLPNIKYTISNYNIDIKIIKELASCKFVYYDGVINSLDELNINIKILFNNNIIYLKCTNKQFESIKKRIDIYLKMICYFKNDNKPIVLYLILTNLKKKIYNEHDSLTAKNINSGYTDLSKNVIFIWRYEEFEKVTFHELIHFFNKDHRYETKYYEAITDFKAINYNIIYISIITNIDIKILLNYEINFINNQCNYISKYKYNTNAYSYYIVKCYLFNKIFTQLDKVINNLNLNSCRMSLFELL